MMTLRILIFLLFAVVGCTVDDAEQTNASRANNNENGSANNVDTTPNNDRPAESKGLVIEVEPVDWGLFSEAPDTTRRRIYEGDYHSAVPIVATLPAGVFRLYLEIDGQPYGLDADRLAPPVGHYGPATASNGGLVFNPAESEFEIAPTDAMVTITRRHPETEVASADDPGHAADVGPLFDAVLETYDPTAEDRSAVFDLLGAIHSRGGAPIATDRGFLFVAPGVPGDSPELVGTFNDWQRTPGWELRELFPGLFARYVELPAGEHAYKIAYGESWTKDQANRHIEWDGINTQSVGFFNSVVRPDPEASRLVLWPSVESQALRNQREVYVYLPPGYTENVEHPLLIVHDGNESIVRAQFQEVLDIWSDGEPAVRQPIVAFVALPSQDVRMAEYTFATDESMGSEYGEFLADELLPDLSSSFRIAEGRQNTGLLGASLGGLISYYVLTQHADLFGYAAGMSSSFFWADNAMLDIIEQGGCFDADFYLDSGSPNDNFVVTQQMRDLLNNQGCRYRYELDEGGTHEWWKWKERLPGVLDHFADVTQEGR